MSINYVDDKVSNADLRRPRETLFVSNAHLGHPSLNKRRGWVAAALSPGRPAAPDRQRLIGFSDKLYHFSARPGKAMQRTSIASRRLGKEASTSSTSAEWRRRNAAPEIWRLRNPGEQEQDGFVWIGGGQSIFHFDHYIRASDNDVNDVAVKFWRSSQACGNRVIENTEHWAVLIDGIFQTLDLGLGGGTVYCHGTRNIPEAWADGSVDIEQVPHRSISPSSLTETLLTGIPRASA